MNGRRYITAQNKHIFAFIKISLQNVGCLLIIICTIMNFLDRYNKVLILTGSEMACGNKKRSTIMKTA